MPSKKDFFRREDRFDGAFAHGGVDDSFQNTGNDNFKISESKAKLYFEESRGKVDSCACNICYHRMTLKQIQLIR